MGHHRALVSLECRDEGNPREKGLVKVLLTRGSCARRDRIAPRDGYSEKIKSPGRALVRLLRKD